MVKLSGASRSYCHFHLPLRRVERVDAVFAAGHVDRAVGVDRLRRDRPVRAIDPALGAGRGVERVERRRRRRRRRPRRSRPTYSGRPLIDAAERTVPQDRAVARREGPQHLRRRADEHARAVGRPPTRTPAACTRAAAPRRGGGASAPASTSTGATNASRATPGTLAPPQPPTTPPTTSSEASARALTNPRAARSASAPRP